MIQRVMQALGPIAELCHGCRAADVPAVPAQLQRCARWRTCLLAGDRRTGRTRRRGASLATYSTASTSAAGAGRACMQRQRWRACKLCRRSCRNRRGGCFSDICLRKCLILLQRTATFALLRHRNGFRTLRSLISTLRCENDGNSGKNALLPWPTHSQYAQLCVGAHAALCGTGEPLDARCLFAALTLP